MDMEADQLAIRVRGELRPLFVRQYLDGEAFPNAQQVDPDLLQDLPAAPEALVPNHEEEVHAEAAEQHVAGEPLGRAAPEQVDAAGLDWDCIWVDTSKSELCLRGGHEQQFVHGSGDYRRLLPPREGLKRCG